MRDQAETLRMKILESQGALGRSIAVVSGKGGVGKSNFITNFAINLANRGKKVVIVDMDIGMANIHILIGQPAQYNLKDYLEGKVTFTDILYSGPYNIHYISGGSALASVVEWSNEMFEALIAGFEMLQKNFDFILFDMGAGASNWSLDLLKSIDEIIVISTSEPTSITDAYSMMKYIHLKDRDKRFYLLCNRVYTNEEGQETLIRLKNTMRKFLSKDVYILGALPEDQAVRKAVIEQVPFTISYPKANVSKSLIEIVNRFVDQQINEEYAPVPSNTFLSKLRRIFSKGRD